MTTTKTTEDIDKQVKVKIPDLKWEEGSFTMNEILDKFSLPLVVKCDPNYVDVPVDGSAFNICQPLLLYNERYVHKYVAHNMVYDIHTHAYIEVGNPLLIPHDYNGWFVQVNASHQEGKLISTCHNMKALVYHRISEFLVAGRAKINALRITNSPPHETCSVFPGDTFRVSGVYSAKTKLKKKGILRDKNITIDEKFLKCFDEKDREIFFPLETTGEFHPKASMFGKLNNPVIQLPSVKNFPTYLKLVYGPEPSTPSCFTGTLKISDSYEEYSVIASTVFNFRNILLETPVGIPLRYQVAKNSHSLLSNEGYRKALLLCTETAKIYMKLIKVAVNMPQLPDYDDNDEDLEDDDNDEDHDVPPPIPPRSPLTEPIRDSQGYEIPLIPTTVSKQSRLDQSVPIKSSPSVRLCFGTSSLIFPVDSNGTLKYSTVTKRRRQLHELGINIFSENSSQETSTEPDYMNYEIPKQSTEGASSVTSSGSPPQACPNMTSPSSSYLTTFLTFENDNEDYLTMQNLQSDNLSDISWSDSGGSVSNEELTTYPAQSDLIKAMERFGFKQNVLTYMQEKNVDYHLLKTLDNETLDEHFPLLKKLELKKMKLFVKQL